MDREYYAFPKQGMQLNRVVIDWNKLSKSMLSENGYKFMWMDSRHDQFNWKCTPQNTPGMTYYFTNIQRVGDPLLCTMAATVFIAMKRKDVQKDRDAFIAYWAQFSKENTQDPIFSKFRLDRRFFNTMRVGYTFMEETKHILHCFWPGIVSPNITVENLKTLFSQLIVGMYSLDTCIARPIRECVCCKRWSEDRMRRCPCGSYYCSKDCQRRDWRAGHKAICDA